MNTNTLLVVLMTLVSSCKLLAGSSRSCQLSKGLYERRVTLDLTYSHVVGNEHSADPPEADQIRKSRGIIDMEYYNAMERMAEQYETKRMAELRECCLVNSKDPIITYMCRLLSYMAAPARQASQFTHQFPGDRVSMGRLWIVNEIVSLSPADASSAISRVFGEQGPDFYGIDVLFANAAGGRKEAVTKVHALFWSVEGDYGEYIQDKLLQLVRDKPEIIIANWNLFKSDLLDWSAFTVLTAEEKEGIKKRLVVPCKSNKRACREFCRDLDGTD